MSNTDHADVFHDEHCDLAYDGAECSCGNMQSLADPTLEAIRSLDAARMTGPEAATWIDALEGAAVRLRTQQEDANFGEAEDSDDY